MNTRSFVYDNSYVGKIQRLYLDSKTADVNFVFVVDTDQTTKVPAHKAILSLNNPVFDAMFYGSVKEGNDIPVTDACVGAFKVFLQFFYLDKVRLTAENIAQVMNLCKKYEMNECMNACETTLRKSLTINDICSGYSIALVLEQKNLIKYCEKKIKLNAQKIIESESFLEAERILLEKILTLVSTDWSPLQRVMACMEWAKADCSRNNLETSPENLKTQLGALCVRIPFEKLTLEQFSEYSAAYSGFFNAEQTLAMKHRIRIQSQLPQSKVYHSYFEQTNNDREEFEGIENHFHLLSEAKRLKHAADDEVDKLKQAISYAEAAVHFLLTGFAIERDGNRREAAIIMYQDTFKFLKTITAKYESQQQQSSRRGIIHSRVAILTLRCQSLTSLKFYKMKKHELNEQIEILSDYLLKSIEVWELADETVINGNHTDFFISLDHQHGPITLHSSFSQLFKYVLGGLNKLKEMTIDE